MMYNPYSLKGKTILVTGASSGIGRATAIECSRLGAVVVITGRNNDELQKTLSCLDGNGHMAYEADVTKESEIEMLVNHLPHLDGIVNNAGIGSTAPITFISSTDIDVVFKTNVIAPMLLTKIILKRNIINKGGALVFTSSTDAYMPEMANSVYAASKGALTTYMRSCAKELAARNIRANAVMPGMVETPFLKNAFLSDEDLKKDAAQNPLKRYGKPEEIAQAICYLLSDATSWMTGSILLLDGGASLM